MAPWRRLTWWPVAGSLIATNSAAAARSVLADRTPPRVVDELEQEEVRKQEDEQGRVAVEDGEGSAAHCARLTIPERQVPCERKDAGGAASVPPACCSYGVTQIAYTTN